MACSPSCWRFASSIQPSPTMTNICYKFQWQKGSIANESIYISRQLTPRETWVIFDAPGYNQVCLEATLFCLQAIGCYVGTGRHVVPVKVLRLKIGAGFFVGVCALVYSLSWASLPNEPALIKLAFRDTCPQSYLFVCYIRRQEVYAGSYAMQCNVLAVWKTCLQNSSCLRLERGKLSRKVYIWEGAWFSYDGRSSSRSRLKG